MDCACWCEFWGNSYPHCLKLAAEDWKIGCMEISAKKMFHIFEPNILLRWVLVQNRVNVCYVWFGCGNYRLIVVVSSCQQHWWYCMISHSVVIITCLPISKGDRPWLYEKNSSKNFQFVFCCTKLKGFSLFCPNIIGNFLPSSYLFFRIHLFQPCN